MGRGAGGTGVGAAAWAGTGVGAWAGAGTIVGVAVGGGAVGVGGGDGRAVAVGSTATTGGSGGDVASADAGGAVAVAGGGPPSVARAGALDATAADASLGVTVGLAVDVARAVGVQTGAADVAIAVARSIVAVTAGRGSMVTTSAACGVTTSGSVAPREATVKAIAAKKSARLNPRASSGAVRLDTVPPLRLIYGIEYRAQFNAEGEATAQPASLPLAPGVYPSGCLAGGRSIITTDIGAKWMRRAQKTLAAAGLGGCSARAAAPVPPRAARTGDPGWPVAVSDALALSCGAALTVRQSRLASRGRASLG